MLFLTVATGCTALVVAFGIGANDGPNAIATTAATGALHSRLAFALGAVFEFLGCVTMLFGRTPLTIDDLLEPHEFKGNTGLAMLVVLSSVVAQAVWLIYASYKGMPISTTHALLSALLVTAVSAFGESSVHLNTFLLTIASWVLSPLMGFVIAFGFMTFVSRHLFENEDQDLSQKRSAVFFSGCFSLSVFVLLLNVGLTLALNVEDPPFEIWVWVVAVGVLCLVLAPLIHFFLMDRILGASTMLSPLIQQYPMILESASRQAYYGSVEFERRKGRLDIERLFAVLQIVAAALMAYTHGLNDVANVVAPFAFVYEINKTGDIPEDTLDTLEWAYVVAGALFALGLVAFGRKTVKTIGFCITRLTPSAGFVAVYATTLVVLLANAFRLPVSTTHTLIGSIAGAGYVGDRAGLEYPWIFRIALFWALTIPAAAAIALVVLLVSVGIDDLWLGSSLLR